MRGLGMRAPVALLLALVGPAACDSSAESDGSDGSIHTRTLSDEEKAACAAYAQAWCAREDECSPYNVPHFYGSLESCQLQSARLCEQELALPGNTQTADRLQQCAQSMPTAICGRAFGAVLGIEACDSPPGTLKNGAACFSDSQCASGDCGYSLSTHCYSCEAGHPKTAHVGEACDPVDGPDCAEGFCYFDTCKLLAQPNQACDDNTICYGLFACRDGICTPPSGEGAQCLSDADCLFGYSCVAGVCAADPPEEKQLGTTCGFGTGSICDIFKQYCAGPEGGTVGKCTPPSEQGQACGYDVFFDSSCASGLECVDGVCILEAPKACN